MHFGGLGMSGDQLYPIYHAVPYLYFFGDVVLGWLHLRMAITAHEAFEKFCAGKGLKGDDEKKKLCLENDEAKFYDGKMRGAKFFMTQLLPRYKGFEASIMSGDRAGLETEP